MKRVVSVSLGTSLRNKAVEVEVGGKLLRVERIGTDGDIAKFVRVVMELDGNADVICFGGMNIYLYCGVRRYAFKQALKLASIPKVTPVVDGSGWKNHVEPLAVDWLRQNGIVSFCGKRVLIVSSVDRAALSRALYEAGCDLRFGDFAFCLGVNLSVRSWLLYLILSNIFVPFVTKLPIRFVYPVGERQERIEPKFANLYSWAEVIAGDFHLIRRHMPNDLSGKVILTNTTTSGDIEELRKRCVRMLVTTTPEFDGRTFGANVMEGIIVALIEKHPDLMRREDYMHALKLMRYQPHVVEF
ncbi:MAG: quinate 5-dehydrogenase [Armatimonadota bacterium]|nr:quinate 5-dehydrogenase [Armatimonadota bacterium]MCX7777524.1 quinate 5-dehydrogenase [Armatimonadota bacterium]MDW8026462.1 quinate 5-dehydrogenase [Armatimonadota bacterium]